MRIAIADRGLFSPEVLELLQAFHRAGFFDILLDFPFLADFGDFQVRAPLPEAYLVQKLLTTARRQVESKKDKDLDQCAVITGRLDEGRLAQVVHSLKLSVKSGKALREACVAIGFPPQRLGLK